MPLDNYKAGGLLFNQNFVEASSSDVLDGYRGELALAPGEVADGKGHHKPPDAVMRGAVLLGDERLHLLIGALDDIAGLEKSDFQGQSATDKIVTLLGELKGYRPNYPSATLDTVLASATDVKRAGWGAV